MKVINTGNTYNIYNDSVKTYEKLPTQVYQVNFNPMAGFSLSLYNDIEIKEKVYGIHIEKVHKVIDTFEKFERSLGIILSGDKGIGKSLFAKMLSIEVLKRDCPVIIVNDYAPGIANFLNSIQQEVMVLFDEFDKNFYSGSKESNSRTDPQTEMLTLFDGLSQGKKMFVITCNILGTLNDYLINRPGRFHYHFRFDYPDAQEIEIYLKDHIPESMYKEIPNVVNFAQKAKINYDSLRAIAFELSLENEDFKTIIKDLNIIKDSDDRMRYTVKVVFKDGECYNINNNRPVFVDTFLTTEDSLDYYDSEIDSRIDIGFVAASSVYNLDMKGLIIPGEKCRVILYEDNYCEEEWKKVQNKYANKQIDYILLQSVYGYNIHYAL